MRSFTTPPSSSVCPRHPERQAVSRCDDCDVTMCGPCSIEVPDLGTFCWACAAARGGLHHGPRGARHAQRERHVVDLPALEEEAASARRFQRAVAERAPHSLISGLADRLAQAGADPEDVVDGAALREDIGRLQEQAAVEVVRHGRWRRR
jgi:hypothetical protein